MVEVGVFSHGLSNLFSLPPPPPPLPGLLLQVLCVEKRCFVVDVVVWFLFFPGCLLVSRVRRVRFPSAAFPPPPSPTPFSLPRSPIKAPGFLLIDWVEVRSKSWCSQCCRTVRREETGRGKALLLLFCVDFSLMSLNTVFSCKCHPTRRTPERFLLEVDHPSMSLHIISRSK